MVRKKILYLIFLLFSCSCLYAQKDSIAYYKKVIKEKKELIGFTKKDSNYIKLLNQLSSKYKRINTDTLAVLSKEALTLSNSIDYKKGTIISLSNLAICKLINGDSKTSIEYNKVVLKLIDKKKFPELGANVYDVMGQAFFSLANHPEAYKHFYESLLLAEIAKNKDLVVKMNGNLGTLFTMLEDYDEALRFYQVALSGMEETDSSVTKSEVQSNLGYLYMKKNDSTMALNFLRKSLSTLKKEDMQMILGIVYNTFGDVYYKNSIFNTALAYYEKAFRLYETLNDSRNEAYSLRGLGTSHLALENFKKSEDYLTKSINLYKKINYKAGLAATYKILYELNKKTNSLDKALKFLELSDIYSDSIYIEKSVRDISMLKAKMEFEEDKANLLLKNEIEVEQQKNYIPWAALGFACVLIVSFLALQANKTERRLNRELTLQTSNLSKKKEELNKINKNQDKLFSIVGHDLRGPIVSLKQLLGLALESEEGVQHFYRFGPKLKKDVDHIHFTLDNLLNWGVTQMQGEPINPVKIKIDEGLLEIEELFRDVLDKKSITVNKSFIDDLVLLVDANHFNISFRNLISNAIKFTPKNGQIWLDIYIKNNTTIISVKDNGVGMSKEVLSRVLDSSEHYTTFGTDNEKGTGLGLVLCKEMITKNNGTLTVESELGKGSVFSIRFRHVFEG
ncbi:MAG: signal transduction histidine kinase [Maribacter sp.]|jgi:signal transduction histidine kinase